MANIFCLAEIHIHHWLYHLVCGWLWMLQPVTMHTLPRTNSNILWLTWVLIVVGFDKIYCSKIECAIIREVYRSPESSGSMVSFTKKSYLYKKLEDYLIDHWVIQIHDIDISMKDPSSKLYQMGLNSTPVCICL